MEKASPSGESQVRVTTPDAWISVKRAVDYKILGLLKRDPETGVLVYHGNDKLALELKRIQLRYDSGCSTPEEAFQRLAYEVVCFLEALK